MSELETLGGGSQNREWPRDREQSRKSVVVSSFLLILVSATVLFITVGLGKIALTEAGIAWVFRGLMLTLAVSLFGIWFWVAWTLVKRRVTTGRFMLGLAEARRRRELQMSKLGAGKPLRGQLGNWLLPLGVSAWLLTASGAIVWEKAAWCDCEPRVVWLVWGLAAFLAALGLIYPGMCVWRKATTGYFLASNERIRARLSRDVKPAMKWQQLLLAALWTVIAIVQTSSTLRKGHAGWPGWLVVASFWFAAVTWTLLLVLKKKPACGAGNRPAGPGDSHGAGDGAPQGLGI
jgi:hypothetical protein